MKPRHEPGTRRRSFELPGGCERDLRAFFAPEYGIYENAVGG